MLGIEFIDWDAQVLNTQFTVLNLTTFIIVLIIGIVLTLIIPERLIKNLSQLIYRLSTRSERKISPTKISKEEIKAHQLELMSMVKFRFEHPVKRFIQCVIFLTFGYLSINALGYNLYTPITIAGFTFTIWRIMIFFLIIFIFWIFIKTVLGTLIEILVDATIGWSMDRYTTKQSTISLLKAFRLLLVYIGVYLAFDVAFINKRQIPFYPVIETLFMIVGVIVGLVAAITIALIYFRVKVVRPRRVTRHAAKALENLILLIGILICIGVILSLFGVESTTIIAVLGITGFAIAFGMQNTIANIMAGFVIAIDKPFVIGDRVRVGEAGKETWGDVVDIGLNSTRIRTVEEELVTIPNSQITSHEIWNYTRDSPVIANVIDIGISYGSDWRLAKKIIIEEARKHPYVLRTPMPFVRIHKFGDFSIEMKLWVWIRDARDKEQIRSDILERVKDRFDAEGVEIPFPYRTIVYKRDLEREKRLPSDAKFEDIKRYPSKGRDYFEVGERTPTGKIEAGPVYEEATKILVPISGLHSARRMAEYSIELAKKFNGDIISLYVMREYNTKREAVGLKVLDIIERMGRRHGIHVATKIETGDVVEKILESIITDKIDLVVIGASRRLTVGFWARDSIAKEIIEKSPVPVVTMPVVKP